MVEKYLNNRILTLYIIPIFFGSLTVFSFEPFNLTIINFLIFPTCFYLLVYINKNKGGVITNKDKLKKYRLVYLASFIM